MIYDLEASALQHMEQNNFAYRGNIVADGRVHRFSIDENQRKTDEWYIAHEGVSSRANPYLICSYGSWSSGEKFTFRSWQEQVTLSIQERLELEKIYLQKKELTEKRITEEREASAHRALKIWLSSPTEPPTPEHLAYTNAKGIEPIGIRYGLYAKLLPMIIIPLYNTNGLLRSLQFIWINESGKRERRFLPGAEKKGNFFSIGDIIDGQPIYITEGYATGVSVYMATQTTTVIAFDAGNILPVVSVLKEKYPQSKITIAADDDDAGREKAKAASLLHGCSLRFPDFAPLTEHSYTDFNDLHQAKGLETVRQQLLNANVALEALNNPSTDTESTCLLLEQTMKKLVEKIMNQATPDSQRFFLGEIYNRKLKEFNNLQCVCHPYTV